MMRSRSLFFVGLVGCGGGTPEGPDAPEGSIELQLSSVFDLVEYHSWKQLPTALGGTQTFTVLRADREPAMPGPVFELPFEVEVVDESVLRIEARQDASFTIRGLKEGVGFVRVRDQAGALLQEFSLEIQEVLNIAIEKVGREELPADLGGEPLWAPGEHTLRIYLYRHFAHRFWAIADSSLVLALPGAERLRFDTLHVPNATVGTFPLSVTAGGKQTTLDFEVVDQADTAALLVGVDPAPTLVEEGRITRFCFEARKAGRYIVGLPWVFTILGNAERSSEANCVSVIPRQPSGEITVGAAAAGQAVSITLPVVST